jgi:hypothetical protein
MIGSLDEGGTGGTVGEGGIVGRGSAVGSGSNVGIAGAVGSGATVGAPAPSFMPSMHPQAAMTASDTNAKKIRLIRYHHVITGHYGFGEDNPQAFPKVCACAIRTS